MVPANRSGWIPRTPAAPRPDMAPPCVFREAGTVGKRRLQRILTPPPSQIPIMRLRPRREKRRSLRLAGREGRQAGHRGRSVAHALSEAAVRHHAKAHLPGALPKAGVLELLGLAHRLQREALGALEVAKADRNWGGALQAVTPRPRRSPRLHGRRRRELPALLHLGTFWTPSVAAATPRKSKEISTPRAHGPRLADRSRMQTTHGRRTYDHRIREAILESGERDLFPELRIPRSTIRSWFHRGLPEITTTELASCDRAALLEPQRAFEVRELRVMTKSPGNPG